MSDKPEYNVYGGSGGRRRWRRKDPDEARFSGPTGPPPPGSRGPEGDERPYRVYRSRRKLPIFGSDQLELPSAEKGGGERRRFGRPSPGRVVAVLLTAIVSWLVLALVLFLVSATLQGSEVDEATRNALDAGGDVLTSANTVLVLGSDKRPANSKEPGAQESGARSDSIMLLRVGAGHSGRLSIPRDTVVDIPGHGPNKINAAFAFGGTALTIETVKQYLGIDINHVIEVDFEDFPKLIDALGGINVKTGCVRADINGGYRNGGVTLKLDPGTNHLNGKQALALSRVRVNRCNPREDDITRNARQQKVLNAVRSRFFSPVTFFRLPQVAWQVPEAIRTDMGGFSLLEFGIAVATGGSPKPQVLKPSGATTLPDGGQALVVSEESKQRAVRRFLRS
jgi:LCP family protein required for cell wall assembly